MTLQNSDKSSEMHKVLLQIREITCLYLQIHKTKEILRTNKTENKGSYSTEQVNFSTIKPSEYPNQSSS